MAVTQSAPATFRPLQSAPADSPAFSIRGLTTTFPGAKAPTVVVDDISLFVRRGETLAVVGEFGLRQDNDVSLRARPRAPYGTRRPR